MDSTSVPQKTTIEMERDKEIERILSTFKLDAYSVLNLKPGVSPSDIKKTYRKISLLIHPDKTSNPQAPDAFDILQKAYSVLDDVKSREELDEIYTVARNELIRERKWTLDEEKLKGDEFFKDWKQRVKDVIIEEELVKKLEKKKQEDEQVLKRKREEEEMEARKKANESNKKWEDDRDKRVDNWRSFTKNMEKKKKKKKTTVLI